MKRDHFTTDMRTCQNWLRQVQPLTLVVWGKYDPSFTVAGATAYAGDVPKAEVHILEAGHFALDEATNEIESLVRNFLERLDRANSVGPPEH